MIKFVSLSLAPMPLAFCPVAPTLQKQPLILLDGERRRPICFIPIGTHHAGQQTTRDGCQVFTETRHASKRSEQIHTADNEKKQE